MNEKYFVAAYLRWQQALAHFDKIRETTPKVGDMGPKISTWGTEVRIYREAKEAEQVARDEFTRVAAEYAQWCYSQV